MQFKKPKFWDYKKPSLLAYILLPFSYLVVLINFIKRKNKKIVVKEIKTICIGNIYVGGTGKTPLSICLSKLLENLNYKTAFIKKKYNDQIDEQKMLSSRGRLYCENDRISALKKAISEKNNIAILFSVCPAVYAFLVLAFDLKFDETIGFFIAGCILDCAAK